MTTKQIQARTLSVPYFKQQAEYYCGPTSLQMVMEFFGVRKPAEEIARIADTNEVVGTWHRNMLNAARASGFFCYENKNATLDELRSFLKKGYPAVVHLLMPEWPEGKWGKWDKYHYVVVIGLTRWHVLLNDPWLGIVKMPRKDFISRWSSEITDEQNWMLVLSPKSFGIFSEYPPFLGE